MQLLELFAGSCSISNVAKQHGIDTITTDVEAYDGIDIVSDILSLDYKALNIQPTIIWASPPCTTFSIASCYVHYRYKDGKYIPITEAAKQGIKFVLKTLEIIQYFKPKYWYIENPRGLLRRQRIMLNLPRTTVWYCKYNDTRAKPTDIWTNNLCNLFNLKGWQPRPQCFNGNTKCHHEAAPRGSRTGTQGLKNNHERSKIPAALCIEIIENLTQE